MNTPIKYDVEYIDDLLEKIRTFNSYYIGDIELYEKGEKLELSEGLLIIGCLLACQIKILFK